MNNRLQLNLNKFVNKDEKALLITLLVLKFRIWTALFCIAELNACGGVKMEHNRYG